MALFQLWAHPPLAAARVFYDAFESGNTNLWSQDSDRNRCSIVTSALDTGTGPRSGTKMASCNSDGVVEWNDPGAFETLTLDTNNYSTEFFVRAWIRRDQNVDTQSDVGSPKVLLGFFHWIAPYDPTTYNDLFDTINRGAGLSNEGVAGGTQLNTYWGGAPEDNTNSTGAWHEIEYYFNLLTGTLKVWHDGVLVRSDTGLPLNNAAWFPLYRVETNTPQEAGARDEEQPGQYQETQQFQPALSGSQRKARHSHRYDAPAGNLPFPHRLESIGRHSLHLLHIRYVEPWSFSHHLGRRIRHEGNSSAQLVGHR